MAHAIFSPSSAHRWLRCTGSVGLCEALPPAPSSVHANEGTFCHDIAATCLTYSLHAPDLVGTKLVVNGSEFMLDAETADEVQCYVDAVRSFSAGGRILVEQQVPVGAITGEEGATGTADALAVVETLDGLELHVHDLKMGRGVEVHAENNEQLMLYALGALEALPMARMAKAVRLFIHQPRLSRDPKIWATTIPALREFASRATAAAEAARFTPEFTPGEKQCRFCPAKAQCPALAKQIQEIVGAQFDDLTAVLPPVPPDLSSAMKAVDMIEQWCSAVRAEVERTLLAGGSVDGFKLVMGRRGARKWGDEAAVAPLLTQALGDDAYTRSLLSVAAAEKKARKLAIWEQVIPLITQAPGSPSVAPESDPRPAYSNAGVEAAFSTVTE